MNTSADDLNPKINFLTATDLERKILATQGFLVNENVWVYDVSISKGHIHTIEAGRKNKQAIILIHGYGATGVFWFKIMAQLSKHFRVYAIDQFGKGLSSRPHFSPTATIESTSAFFCGAIEEWRRKLDITDFLLMGHSFGGYTAAQYVFKMKPPVKKLYLLSPAGFTLKKKKDIMDLVKNRKQSRSLGAFRSMAMRAYNFAHHLTQDLRFTPFQLANMFGRQRGLSKYFGADRLKLTKQQSKLFGEYYYLITELKASGDKALGIFLYFARYSKKPIINGIAELEKTGKAPGVMLLYGDRDWMDTDHSKEKIKEFGASVEWKIIKNSGHQIALQAPIQVAKIITEDQGIKFQEVIIESCLDKNYLIKSSKLLK